MGFAETIKIIYSDGFSGGTVNSDERQGNFTSLHDCEGQRSSLWTLRGQYSIGANTLPLAAVLDWHSRRVLAHRVSITMEADFCVAALQEAIARYGKPEIMNTDQDSQFTGAEFIDELKKHGIAISMDGRGQWCDNVFVERLWKSIKYEEVYLKAYDSVSAARAGVGTYWRSTTRARRRGQPCIAVDQPAANPLISARLVFKGAEPLLRG